MNFVWLSILIIIHLLCGLQICVGKAPKGHPKETKTQSVEKLLIRKLLSRYERFGVIGRPVNDSKIKVIVSFGLQMFQILDLDENKQILRTNCWGNYAWDDSLLEWNPQEYRNIISVRFFPSQIWTPDIKLYNFADERLKERREARVVIYSTGRTLWIPQALFKSTCEVEISYFPFDTQICMLEFGSWTYDKTQMDLIWWKNDNHGWSPYLDFSDYVPSNEWRTDGEFERLIPHPNRTRQIKSVKKYRRRNHTVGSKIVTREYPVLRFLVRLRRNPSFYVCMLVIPCVLLSSLTMVVFWLPPESPAKMMLGMNIFVAFFVLLLLLAESTPSAVKNFPLIGVFFCINMIMITLSTFLATLVIHLHFRGDRNGAVPAFLRRFVIEGIGRLICVRQRIPLPEVRKTSSSPRTKSKLNKSKNLLPNCSTNEHAQNEGGSFYGPQSQFNHQVFPNRQSGFYPRGVPGPNHLAYYDPQSLAFSAGTGATEHFGTMPNFEQTNYLLSSLTHGTKLDSKSTAVDSEDSADLLGSTVTLERDVREIKRYVKIFINRQKEMQRKSLGAMEWRTLALVLDRLFFFVYVATIAISVLVGIPRTTEPEVPEAFRDDS